MEQLVVESIKKTPPQAPQMLVRELWRAQNVEILSLQLIVCCDSSVFTMVPDYNHFLIQEPKI